MRALQPALEAEDEGERMHTDYTDVGIPDEVEQGISSLLESLQDKASFPACSSESCFKQILGHDGSLLGI